MVVTDNQDHLQPRPLDWVEKFFDEAANMDKLSDSWTEKTKSVAKPTGRQLMNWMQEEYRTFDRTVSTDKAFEVFLGINGFQPSDLKVSVDDGYVVVRGNHEETSEDGSKFVSRQFVRRHLLPKETDLDRVKSTLMDGNVLRIEAPMKPLERIIPITMTSHKSIELVTQACGA